MELMSAFTTTAVPSQATSWPFGSLRPHGFDLILADPPWNFQNYSEKGELKNPVRHYNCLTLDALKTLPVAGLAAPDSVLVTWAVWSMLPQALDLMTAWGFLYKSGGTWAKQSKTGGKWSFSTGYILRGACEPFILATRGNPKRASKSERNLIVAPVREHSRKPAQMHETLERLFPDARRLELFARESRPGWQAWGDEVGKFDPRRKGAAE
jgi:N6-adenosine-specific RNA methylase IME4